MGELDQMESTEVQSRLGDTGSGSWQRADRLTYAEHRRMLKRHSVAYIAAAAAIAALIVMASSYVYNQHEASMRFIRCAQITDYECVSTLIEENGMILVNVTNMGISPLDLESMSCNANLSSQLSTKLNTQLEPYSTASFQMRCYNGTAPLNSINVLSSYLTINSSVLPGVSLPISEQLYYIINGTAHTVITTVPTTVTTSILTFSTTTANTTTSTIPYGGAGSGGGGSGGFGGGSGGGGGGGGSGTPSTVASTSTTTTSTTTSSTTSSTTAPTTTVAQTVLWIYNDPLNASWSDASYGGTANFSSTNEIYSGNFSLRFILSNLGGSLYLHDSKTVNALRYNSIDMYLRGSSPGQGVYLFLSAGSGNFTKTLMGVTTATWQHMQVGLLSADPSNTPFSYLGITSNGLAGSSFFIANLSLRGPRTTTTTSTSTTTTTTTTSTTSTSTTSTTITVPPSSFVSASNGNFYLNGKEFHFAGTNAYYLLQFEDGNPTLVNNTLSAFEQNNITVVRTWAFLDGSSSGGNYGSACGTAGYSPLIQTAPEVYNQTSLRMLDQVVADAEARHLKIIMTLTNYWGDLGGICQYLMWAGFAANHNPNSTDENYFYTNATVQGWYRHYVAMLLNRTNTVTGIKYKNDPGIFAWEVMNEPRWQANGANAVPLANWLNSTAGYIHSLDPNHMVSSGEEGFDENTPSVYKGVYSNNYWERAGTGSSFLLDSQLKNINFMTAHLYPSGYGMNEGSDAVEYIRDHYNVSEMYGKPFILEEYGYDGANATGQSAQKTNAYLAWWGEDQNLSIGGDMLWQFVYGSTKCSESGSNICTGIDPTLTALLQRHAVIMGALPNHLSFNGPAPTIAITSPANGLNTSSPQLTITGTASGNSLLYVQVSVNGGQWGSANGTSSWSYKASLIPGTDTIRARATNLALNYSGNATVTVNFAPPPATTLWIYNGSLNSSWADASWSGTANYANTNPVYNHTHSIAFTTSTQWSGLSMSSSPKNITNPASYNSLSLYIYGGTGTPTVGIGFDSCGSGSCGQYVVHTTGSWQQVTIPMSLLDPGYGQFNRIDFQDQTAGSTAFYVDDMRLVPK